MGQAFTVYLTPSPGYFNCIQHRFNFPAPDMQRFKAGHKYQVVNRDTDHAWLLDVTLPECVQLPNGA